MSEKVYIPKEYYRRVEALKKGFVPPSWQECAKSCVPQYEVYYLNKMSYLESVLAYGRRHIRSIKLERMAVKDLRILNEMIDRNATSISSVKRMYKEYSLGEANGNNCWRWWQTKKRVR